MPDVVCDLGAVCKEHMVRLLARRSVDAAGIAVETRGGWGGAFAPLISIDRIDTFRYTSIYSDSDSDSYSCSFSVYV